MNKLFYGDNLDILKRYIPEETVDLVYLDPPFNSNATYNVLFSQPMRTEAASAGFYDSPWGKHPKVQILTIEDLLSGKQIDMPPIRQVNQIYRRAQRHKADKGKQLGLLEE